LQNKCILLALLAFLTIGSLSAQAESAPEQTAVPANMNDEALASYISGRLAPLLKDAGYQVRQNCDSSGCAVVVQ
jgi:hypothetical protein